MTDLAAGTDDLPPTDAVLLSGESLKVVVRPSGTEPKLKCYLEARHPAEPRRRSRETRRAGPGPAGPAAGRDGGQPRSVRGLARPSSSRQVPFERYILALDQHSTGYLAGGSPWPSIHVSPAEVHEVLARSVLTDGMKLVVDLKAQPRLPAGRRPQRQALPGHVHLLRLRAAGAQPARARRRPGLPGRAGRDRGQQAGQPGHVQHGVRGVRGDLRPGARRPGAAPPVLRRGRGAGRGERAQGGVRLEVAAQRGGRPGPPAGHQGPAPDARPSTAAAATPCR